MKWNISHTIVRLQLSLQRQGQEGSFAKVGKVFPSSLTQVSVSLLKYCCVLDSVFCFSSKVLSCLPHCCRQEQVSTVDKSWHSSVESWRKFLGELLKVTARHCRVESEEICTVHSFTHLWLVSFFSNSKVNFFTLPVSCAHIIFVSVINFAARVAWQCQPVLW